MSGGENGPTMLQGNAYATGHSKKSQGYRQIEQHYRKCLAAIRMRKPKKRKVRTKPVPDTPDEPSAQPTPAALYLPPFWFNQGDDT